MFSYCRRFVCDRISETEIDSNWQNLLEAQKHKLQPQPRENEHEQHVGEWEAEPTCKVDYSSIIWEESVDKKYKLKKKHKTQKKITEKNPKSIEDMRKCLFSYVRVVLIDLALHDDIGCSSSEGGRSSDAGSVTNTEAHAFRQLQVLLLPLYSSLLGIWTPLTNHWGDRAETFIIGNTQLCLVLYVNIHLLLGHPGFTSVC